MLIKFIWRFLRNEHPSWVLWLLNEWWFKYQWTLPLSLQPVGTSIKPLLWSSNSGHPTGNVSWVFTRQLWVAGSSSVYLLPMDDARKLISIAMEMSFIANPAQAKLHNNRVPRPLISEGHKSKWGGHDAVGYTPMTWRVGWNNSTVDWNDRLPQHAHNATA